jgi:hypothetical protein
MLALLYVDGMDETVIAEAKAEILKRIAVKGFTRPRRDMCEYAIRAISELIAEGIVRDEMDGDGLIFVYNSRSQTAGA